MFSAVTAFDAGYLTGLLLGPPVLAFLVMWGWGAVRHEGGNRARAGLRHAWSVRTLALAGFFFLAGAIGRMGGS